MDLIVNFDLYSDFYSDPQLRAIFEEEYLNKVPSSTMWALLLYHHPKSKYYAQEPETKLALIEKDYLKRPLILADYENTISKIERFLMTKPIRLLKQWEDDLEERDQFMRSLPYNAENFDIKEKLLTNRLKMWESYISILKKVAEEEELLSRGDTELSLLEKGLLS